jgi:hypothetical protein
MVTSSGLSDFFFRKGHTHGANIPDRETARENKANSELNSKWLHLLGSQISFSGKDALMERIYQTERQQERTAKPTGQAGPRPWEIGPYIYQEEPREEKRSSHSDPRLELAQQSHDQQQDSNCIPSDEEDCGYGSLAFGSDFMSHLGASSDDLGTLAGRSEFREMARQQMGIKNYNDARNYRRAKKQGKNPTRRQEKARAIYEQLKEGYGHDCGRTCSH